MLDNAFEATEGRRQDGDDIVFSHCALEDCLFGLCW